MTCVVTSAMLEIFINGVPRQLDVSPALPPGMPITVAILLEREGLAGKRLAVEKNGAIVPKSQHADTPLVSGDRLEIVVAVGGG